jgi:hypothetical protein
LALGQFARVADSMHTDHLILNHAPSLNQLPSINVSANMTLLDRA